ncbi:kinetochore Sim4 complex subunit FTA2-domain-containing protein [Nemania abortiva]|nr:kinetochore Sim4 complex subunit FTA2-domain-containing protein [Nemania abortiva]
MTELPPLPPCRGPKLHAFEHQNAPIEWVSRLDGDRDDDGIEGYVFEVKIKSKTYALKVFKFIDPFETEYYWGPILGDSCPLEKVLSYTDPFYAECRAFGRIQQAYDEGKVHRNQILAVKCHGYLFLSDEDLLELEERGYNFETGVLDDEDLRRAFGSGGRVRAIVKDLEVDNKGLNSGNIRKAFERVRALNQLKIYNRDVRAANIMNCRLVDFGSSWTEPHEILSASSQQTILGEKLAYMLEFDQMIADENIKTRFKALPDEGYCNRKLRSWCAKQ